jgi:hypothetical protein
MTVRSCDVWRMIVKEDGRSTVDVLGTKVHFKVVYQVWKCRCSSSATFSNLIYHFKMDFRSSNVNRAPGIFSVSYVIWYYSHASSDIYWENTILHIVMAIQFNFENNTQISSVKVCIHIFGGPCILLILPLLKRALVYHANIRPSLNDCLVMIWSIKWSW